MWRGGFSSILPGIACSEDFQPLQSVSHSNMTRFHAKVSEKTQLLAAKSGFVCTVN